MAALREGPYDVDVEHVILKAGDGARVDAIHARPEGMPIGGVVVHPDIGGLRPLFDDLVRRLATHGFAVMCPEPFARLHAAGRDLSSIEARMGAMHELDDAVQIADLELAADRLVVLDDVHEVAVLGFCMGGMFALKAAAGDRFDKAVDFYGMVRTPEPWKNATRTDPIDHARETVPTLAIYGDNDAFAPMADVEALQAAFAGLPNHEVVVYPGGEHGFVHDPERPTHRADEAADAWQRVLTFLGAS